MAPFKIHCYRCGEVFVCIGEDAWPRRQLILDAARAANRFAVFERRNLLFHWPQPGAAADGHTRAFRAFFLHQMGHCARALIAGARPAELLGHQPPAEAGLLGSHFYISPNAIDGEGKKHLWRLLRAWMGE